MCRGFADAFDLLMKKIAVIVLVIAGVFYPLAIYKGTQAFSPSLFSLVILALSVLKFITAKDKSALLPIAVLLFGLIYSACLALTGSALLLRFYPVAISFMFALMFALSLFQDESLIEEMSRLAGKTITANAKRYTHRLTLIWAMVLSLNGFIALYLSLFASIKEWALYCGLVCYLIFGLIFLTEWIYRAHYIRRYGE